MLSVKPGAAIIGVAAPLFFVATIWDQICGNGVITEGSGGVHHPGSLHYVGLALDLRTRDVPSELLNGYVEELKARIGDEFDVIKEGDHLHVEMQLKKPVNL